MLNPSQVSEYYNVGAIVVPEVLTSEEVRQLRRITDEIVDKSRSVTHNDDVYDLEDTHSAQQPRVRRIKSPELRHPAYAALVRHTGIVAVLKSLWGPNIRFDGGKLNMKAPGGGAAVEWHQDWAFYPHTNDDLAAVGVMIDDMEQANGPLMVVSGSHRGPIFDHHSDGIFCGAIDSADGALDLSRAIALTGRAGSITVHHVRTVHGSAPNLSKKERRLLLLQYRAADAWPLLGFPDGWAAYNNLMVSGASSVTPRLKELPVRLPFPPASREGSIYEIQKGLTRPFFEAPNLGDRSPSAT